jgi:hypothetical protein
MCRKRLGLSDKKCCDFVFFFKSANHCTLIFVELKGIDVSSAEEQIVTAYQAMSTRSAYIKSCRPFAIIVSSGAAPRNRKDIQKRMKTGGISLYFGTSRKGSPCEIKDVIKELAAQGGRPNP